MNKVKYVHLSTGILLSYEILEVKLRRAVTSEAIKISGKLMSAPIESLPIQTVIKMKLRSSLKTVITKKRNERLEENFYLMPGKSADHKTDS